MLSSASLSTSDNTNAANLLIHRTPGCQFTYTHIEHLLTSTRPLNGKICKCSAIFNDKQCLLNNVKLQYLYILNRRGKNGSKNEKKQFEKILQKIPDRQKLNK